MKSETMAAAKDEEGHKALEEIPGIEPAMAENIFNKGIKSISMLAVAEPEILSSIPGVSEAMAQQWIEDAGKILDREANSLSV